MRFTDRARQAADEILDAFRRGDLPRALADVFIHFDQELPCHRWSWRNRLIATIHGHADARGFRQWKEVGRTVRKGEHAFYILAPCLAKPKEPESGPGQDDEGEGPRLVGFRDVPVFGYSQTEGEPLPHESRERAFLEALPLVEVARAWGLAVEASDAGPAPTTRGVYTQGKGIRLHVRNLATWAHELVHVADDRLGQLAASAKVDREIVAELGGAVLLECIGEPVASDRGGAFVYLEAQCRAAGTDLFSACAALIDRTCACVSLILETAAQVDTGERRSA
jgi:hypothetical protein